MSPRRALPQVVAIDLPGFGQTPPLGGEVSITTLADAVAGFLDDHKLSGIDMVGSSMGARLVLELARRGVGGTAVALDPGGFWSPAELQFFGVTLGLSIRLVRLLQPVMRLFAANPVTRTLLLTQLSARPWAVDADLARQELRSWAQSPSFDAVAHDLVHGAPQQGAPTASMSGPVVIGWGRKDRLTFPRQARCATQLFPGARLEWFEDSGHFPHWHRPQGTVDVILATTG